MKKIETYIAFDGMHFSTEQECIEYEKKMSPDLTIRLIEKWLIEEFQYNTFIVWADVNKIVACQNALDTATEIYKALVDFTKAENDAEDCSYPAGLFDYCIKENSFGDVCDVYGYDMYSNTFVPLLSYEGD